MTDKIHPFPLVKAFISKLPLFLRPNRFSYGLVLALDEGGNIAGSLQDPTGKDLREITSVHEQGGACTWGVYLPAG